MRALSWNIQWGRGADGVVDLERTVAAIRDAGPLDVICLQEVARNFDGLPGGAGEDEVAFLAAAFEGYAPVFGAAVDVPGRRGGRALFGNLLLSRLPVGQVFRHMLPAPADPGLPAMQRVCVEAVISAPTRGTAHKTVSQGKESISHTLPCPPPPRLETSTAPRSR